MSKELEWDVIREHEGDRFYKTGDVRIGTEAELGHLSPKCLQPRAAAAAGKKEPALLNKAEVVKTNKAAPRRKAK
jgi:hypothetical protein